MRVLGLTDLPLQLVIYVVSILTIISTVFCLKIEIVETYQDVVHVTQRTRGKAWVPSNATQGPCVQYSFTQVTHEVREHDMQRKTIISARKYASNAAKYAHARGMLNLLSRADLKLCVNPLALPHGDANRHAIFKRKK